jgi:DNA-3-methyladenine glycosylase
MGSPLSASQLLALAPLARGFYQRDTIEVAEGLLGKVLVRALPEGVVVARIDEVEAYLGVEDPAAHTYRGRRTARNETMWGYAGHLYVYFTYGMHHCANVVAREAEVPQAVLLRGAVALLGEDSVRARRGGRRDGLLDGPAKLCQGLGLDRTHDGLDLTTGSGLWVADDGWIADPSWVRRLPRVGVGYAGEAAQWPLRLVLALPGGPRAGERGAGGRGPGGGRRGKGRDSS